MGNCLRNANREINKKKYNKNVHKKFGWRGGILVERSEKGVEGHFELRSPTAQTAFTLDKDEKYEKVKGEAHKCNPIPKVLDLVANEVRSNTRREARRNSA